MGIGEARTTLDASSVGGNGRENRAQLRAIVSVPEESDLSHATFSASPREVPLMGGLRTRRAQEWTQ